MAAQQLNQLTEDYAALKEKDISNSEVVRKLTEEMEQIPQLLQRVTDLTSDNSKLNTQVEELNSKLKDHEVLSAENEKLKKRDLESAAVVQQLMGDVEVLKRSSTPPREAAQREGSSSQELERLRAELEEEHGQQIVMMKEQLREQMKAEVEELSVKLEAAVTENRDLRQHMKLSNDSQQELLDTLRKEKESVVAEVESLRQQNEEYSLKVEQLQRHLDSETTAAAQLERATKDLDALRTEKASVDQEFDDLKQKHEEDELKISQLQTDLMSAMQSSEDEVANATWKMENQLKDEQSRFTEALDAGLQATKQRLETEIDKLTARLEGVTRNLEDVKSKNEALKSSKEEVQEELEQLRSRKDEETAGLKKKVAEQEVEIERLKEDMKTQEMSVTEAQVSGSKDEENITEQLEEKLGEQISVQKEEFTKGIENLTRQLTSATEQKASLENQLRKTIQEKAELEEVLVMKTTEHQKEVKRLKEELKNVDHLSQQLKEANARESSSRTEIALLQRRLETIDEEETSSPEEVPALQAKPSEDDVKKRIGELQRKVVEIQEDKTKVLKELADKEEAFEKERMEWRNQIQQAQDLGVKGTAGKDGRDSEMKAVVKNLRDQIVQYRSQIVDLGGKLDAAVRENSDMSEAFKRAKIAIRDYENKNPDLAALRKEIEDRDTTIQVMWIENEDLKGEIVKLKGGVPSPSIGRSPMISPATSQVSVASGLLRSPHISPAESQTVLNETLTPVRVEYYQASGDEHSPLSKDDLESQELDLLRKKDSENIDLITRLIKELEGLRAAGGSGSFASGEQLIAQSTAHEDSPVVFQLKIRVRELEKQKEDLIKQRRELDSKLDLEVQTSNEEKKKLTRQVTEWRDWYQTLSVQLADYEQDIKKLKQLREDNATMETQLKELGTDRDRVTEELKQLKKSVADFDQKHPNVAKVRKQMDDMRSTLQVHWLENEQLKKQLDEFRGQGSVSASTEVETLKNRLKEAEEELSRLKQPAAAEPSEEPDTSDAPSSPVKTLANMTQIEMQEHFKSLNSNLALATAEKQGLMSKIKELEQKLSGAGAAEPAAGSKPKRKTSREENLAMENQQLQSKVQSLEVQLKEAKKSEQGTTPKLAPGKTGRRSGGKEERLSVPERQTFQNKIKELEMQLKEARKLAKESPGKGRPLKKGSKEDSLVKEDAKSLKQKLQAATEDKESLKSKLKAAETQLKIEQVEKTSLEARAREQEAQLEAEQGDGGAAKPSSKQRRKHHKELAAMQRKYDEELREVRKQLEETRIQYASEVELLQNEHALNLQRLRDLEGQPKEGHSSGSDAESASRDATAKIRDLETELLNVSTERDRLLRRSDSRETDEFELHEMKMRVDALETEKLTMSSTIENLEKEKQELEHKMSAHKTADSSVPASQAVLQILRAELEQLKTAHQAELEALKTEVEVLRAATSTEAATTPEAGATALSAEEELEQTKATHQAVIQLLMSELDQLKIDHKAELERVKYEMKRIREESNELKCLRAAANSSEEANVELRARLEELRSERDALEDRVRALETEKDTLETEGLKLVSELKQQNKVRKMLIGEYS